MSSPSLLAIDAGKTGTRAARYVGGLRGRVVVGPGIANVATEGGLDQIRTVLTGLVQELSDLEDDDAVCIGMTGVLAPDHYARTVADVLAELVGARRIAVTSDVVTNYCGALGPSPGVVVAAGTGSIILAVGSDGTLARVDGWGYLLDDSGSAFEIGRRGLREVLRATDGRGGSTALLDRATHTFGSAEVLVEQVYGAANPARVIAAFAREVTAAATDGDDVSIRLLAEAGEHLADSALAAAARVFGPDTDVVMSWQGGVFNAGELVLAPFRSRVSQGRAGVTFRPPAGDALDGAAAIAGLREPTVLDALVAVRETTAS